MYSQEKLYTYRTLSPKLLKKKKKNLNYLNKKNNKKKKIIKLKILYFEII